MQKPDHEDVVAYSRVSAASLEILLERVEDALRHLDILDAQAHRSEAWPPETLNPRKTVERCTALLKHTIIEMKDLARTYASPRDLGPEKT